jgi:hypothetical protein
MTARGIADELDEASERVTKTEGSPDPQGKGFKPKGSNFFNKVAIGGRILGAVVGLILVPELTAPERAPDDSEAR